MCWWWGGGQSGLAIAQGLRRDGVYNVVVLDKNQAGQEGVWENFARMPELRSPKAQNGMDFGQPSLSVQKWFQARHGMAEWERIERIPRRDWMDYLRWYRATLDLPVENDVAVTDIRRGPRPGVVTVQTSLGVRLARSVVIATGFEGGGVWRVPEVVSAALPPDRYDHACTPIDFARLRGAARRHSGAWRIGVRCGGGGAAGRRGPCRFVLPACGVADRESSSAPGVGGADGALAHI